MNFGIDTSALTDGVASLDRMATALERIAAALETVVGDQPTDT